MKKNVIAFTATMLSTFVCSFILNYVWESYHAVFLYENHNFRAEKYVQMMTYVSVVDSFLISGIYLLIAALWKDLFWLLTMDRKHMWAACVTGVAFAAFIEYRKVFILKIWSYTALMPTVFGIGISPLVQLPATGLLAFWLTRRLLYQKKK